jgi:TolB-like protein
MIRQLGAAFLVLTLTAATSSPAAAEQPTLAVLPFANLSGDPAQDDLSEVVTDNTVKILSKVGGLFVVTGGSAVVSQDKPLPDVAKELDVRYVLQGGVQQSGDSVKMTAELIDSGNEKTVWSEDYERKLKAIFDIQDEITRQVATSLGVQLTPEEQQRIWHRQTSDLEAYQAYLKGREHYLVFTKDDMAEAQRLYQKALALDPEFATAWAGLGSTHIDQANYQWVKDPAAAWASATEAGLKALAIDESNAYALSVLASIEDHRGDPVKAVALSEKAAAFAPNDAWMNARLGARLVQSAGKPKEGLDLINKGMRLNHAHPAVFIEFAGWAYYTLGDYDQALAAFEEYHKRSPDDTDGDVEIVYTSATMGQLEKAKAGVAELLEKHPDFTIDGYSSINRFKDPAVVKLIRDNTAKAGLPQ